MMKEEERVKDAGVRRREDKKARRKDGMGKGIEDGKGSEDVKGEAARGGSGHDDDSRLARSSRGQRQGRPDAAAPGASYW